LQSKVNEQFQWDILQQTSHPIDFLLPNTSIVALTLNEAISTLSTIMLGVAIPLIRIFLPRCELISVNRDMTNVSLNSLITLSLYFSVNMDVISFNPVSSLKSALSVTFLSIYL
jgi:hypothetical protein